MNLIYSEYIQFLKDKGVNLDLKEGYYWLDKQIIKAFDTEGNVYKIARLFTDDNLNITYKVYNNKEFKMASWMDIVNLHKSRLLDLISIYNT